MKKILFSLFLFCLSISTVEALEINSKYAVLYNLNEDKVIYEINKNEKTSIASLTKIMTTLVAIEKIKNYNEKVIIKNSMFTGLKEEGAAVIGIKEGQELTYNDLLYGMFLASGADATRAIAISLVGSEGGFVALMNQKAQNLGLKKTHFQNTVGLDAKEHYSTVDEVASILKEAYKNEKFREIFLAESYTFSDDSFTVHSSFRKTAEKYNIETDSVLGAKTGYTLAAERCLASIAQDKENKITYLFVTTNAEKTPMHITDTMTVYNYYLQNYKYHNLVNKKEFLIKIPVKYSKINNIKFYAKRSISKYLKNDFNKEDVKLIYKGEEKLTPKIKTGTKIGKIEVLYQEKVVDTIEIMLENKIHYSLVGFLTMYHKFFIIISIIIFILLIRIIRKKRSRKDIL